MRVLTSLHPRREQLWQLVEAGYTMDWFCYVGSYATEHLLELPRQLMVELPEVPGDVLLDLYHDEPDED